MQEIYVENLKEIIRSRSILETELCVKIMNKGHNIFVEGPANKEFLAVEVLMAINLGFSADKALELKRENFMLQILNIKDITKRNDIERVRARIIGTRGKTLRTLSNLTNCGLSINNNDIGIIGHAEAIREAILALTSLIQGSRQGSVYAKLERRRWKNDN